MTKAIYILFLTFFASFSYAVTFPTDINDNVIVSSNPGQIIDHLEVNGPLSLNLIKSWHVNHLL